MWNFGISKVLDRMNAMLENAMNGADVETAFDETKMSALESKFHQYLAMTNVKAQRLAEEKESVNALISNISHQTKNPIANILLYSALLSEQQALPEQSRELVSQIEEQSQKLRFLIEALIKSSRLEAGIITVNPARNAVKPLLERAISQLASKAADKKIAVSLQAGEETALFDGRWTEEAVANILDNAVKYTGAGGVIRITVTPYELFCRVDLADSGMGIAQEELSKVFGRFYRSPASAQTEGVGIGLFLAREIVLAQGGYIKASSKAGEGSVFSVFLPR